MFAKRIKTVFNKLLAVQKKYNNKPDYKTNVGDKVFFKPYCMGNSFWQDGIITKMFGQFVYIVRGPK